MDERVAAILSFPAELMAYQRWLEGRQRQTGGRDYLFADDMPRFEPRRGDVAVVVPGLAVTKPGRLALQGKTMDVDGSPRDTQRILAAMDGERCLLEARISSGVAQDAFGRFLRATFGRVVLAPRAVAALDDALPGVELVRFACPPYCIDRAYWENMIDVRQRITWDAMHDDASFLRHLRELHVIALMGARLDSFYQPASPVADHTVAPGALHDEPVEIRETPSGTLFMQGLRVKAPLLGGEAYHKALYRDLGDEGALDGSCEIAGDLPWGRVVVAQSERDDAPAPWFVPPRPIQPGHISELRGSLLEAKASQDAQRHLARFHQSWVRLHPFGCANQSLAMNLVNEVLRRTHGAGMPHGILDHLALRLSREAYAEAFRRAVAAHIVVDSDRAARLATQIERKQRANAAISRLAKGQPIDDADGGRWALLTK